jgi:AraC family transcriptional regulator, arabinose operon regulatory protein
VALPVSVVNGAQVQPLFTGLFPTDIGWYPAATGHYRARPAGADETIFMHCVEGAGWCELDGRRHEVREGDLIALPPGRPHAYGADGRRPWTIRWFHLIGDDLPALCEALGVDGATPVRSLADDATLALLFDDALSVLELGYTGAHLLRASRALAHYLAHASWLIRHLPVDAPDADARIARCIEYMRLHMNRPLRLAELAALAHWSPSHFKARFREHTGYGCIDYFIRLRVHAACQLLDTTTLDIQSVAARVGYADPLWFSKAFKGIIGLSPSTYRQKIKG